MSGAASSSRPQESRTPTRQRRQPAFTLTEVLVATGLGSIVLTAVAFLTLYGSRSSVAICNYTDLDAQSRYALDVMSRELRQATAITAVQPNLPVKSLTLINADQGKTLRLVWDSDTRTMLFQVTGQPDQTLLTECDRWDFSFFSRTPWVSGSDIQFYPATNSAGNLDPKLCKLITMSWKCSRKILGQKVNTETVQTAQIVLRNKQ